jgi:hypothetical protein
MVTISIAAEAFAAITATLPEGLRAQARPDGKGGYLIVLPRATYSTGETLDYTIRRLRALGLWPSMGSQVRSIWRDIDLLRAMRTTRPKRGDRLN